MMLDETIRNTYVIEQSLIVKFCLILCLTIIKQKYLRSIIDWKRSNNSVELAHIKTVVHLIL